jgi:hypothetical protein
MQNALFLKKEKGYLAYNPDFEAIIVKIMPENTELIRKVSR